MIEVRGWGLVGLRVRDGTGTVPYGDIVICVGTTTFMFSEKSPD